MPIESASYIYDLVPANPPGTDSIREGDDHLRLIKQVTKQTFPHITGPNLPVTTGSANAQVVTHAFAPPAYVDGQVVFFKPGFGNTALTTIAVNSLPPVKLYSNGGQADGGELQVGIPYVAVYDASIPAFHIVASGLWNISSGGGGGGGHTARDVFTSAGALTLLTTDEYVLVHNTTMPLVISPPTLPTANQTVWIKDATGTAGQWPISFNGTLGTDVNPNIIESPGGDVSLVFRSGIVYRKTA